MQRFLTLIILSNYNILFSVANSNPGQEKKLIFHEPKNSSVSPFINFKISDIGLYT